MRNKKIIALFSGLIGSIATALVVATISWFGGRNSVATLNNLGGSVLQSYFHSGDGSSTNPFTITTPIHYENFVRLHYEMDDFAESKFYFEFGANDEKMPGYPLDHPAFYATNANGRVDFENTSSVLNLGKMELPPLGTEEEPFLAKVNGNNLTISNFTIIGDGYHDIGIFGFVGENNDGTGASIQNAYFSDFTISTKGASASKHQHSGNVDGRAHNENAHVGYIAGHVVRSSSINNVYVNNCTIDGKTTKDRAIDTYGYYGKVEYDHTDGQRHDGNNYFFDLSAKEVYNAINSNYASIRDNPLRSRVGADDDDAGRHYADYDFPIEGEPDWANNRATHPVSEAITRVNANTYRLNGTTTEAYANRSYSLSTVGYQPLTGSVRNEYEISSTDSRWTNPENVTLKRDAPSINNQPEAGDFFRYDSTGQQWYYQHSENDTTSYRDAVKMRFNLSTITSFTQKATGIGSNPKFSETPVAYAYLDGELVYTSEVNATVSRPSSGNAKVDNISLKNIPYFEKEVCRGTHYFAFFVIFHTETNAMRFAYLCDSNTSISFDSNDARNISVTPGVFEVTQDMYFDASTTIQASKYDGAYRLSITDVDYNLNVDTSMKWNGTIPHYVNPNSFEIPLSGTKRSDGSTALLKESTIDSFTRETITEIEYDEQGNSHEVTKTVWVATDNPTRSPDNTANPVYISDAQSLKDANYKYKNIDIVGGGVDFYYLGSILFFQVNLEVISLPPETGNTNIVEMPSQADLDGMQQFYATKYCPGSVVMYVINTGNGLDNVDSQLGHVEFTYANMNIGGRTLINVTRPSFKKGNGNFVNVETLGRVQEGEQLVNFVSTFEGDITESGARKTSYVCLDKQGKMLGIYDLNGNPGYGFFKAASTEPSDERYRHVTYTPGTTQYDQNPYGTYQKDPNGTYVLNEERVRNIDTYVIVLGSSSNSSTNGTYITDIKFAYQAHVGAGGSFGPVGYRDATDTITDTILNFYIDAPAALNYSITVYFNKNDSIYYITFSADGEVTINIFNYEFDTYSVSFNGSKLPDSELNQIQYVPPSG